MSNCLYCYKETLNGDEFHKKCSQSFFGSKTPPHIPYSFYEMSELAKQVVKRSISVPGVQPKLSMSTVDTGQTSQRLTVVGALGGSYIFKPPSKDFTEMPENEHLTMKLAQLFNIDVVPNSLVKLSSGELSYITKRIDRATGGAKIHMIDMFQVVEAFDKYRGSMERIAKAINTYSSNTLLDILRFYEITIFCYLTGNNDMHYKNFSMIKTSSGWALAPAYDLLNVAILNPLDTEELALSIAGKKKKITKEVLINFGLKIGLTQKQISGVFKRFSKFKIEAKNLINASFLSSEMKSNYSKLLLYNYIKLEL